MRARSALVEVGVALVGDAAGEVGRFGGVVRREDPVEVRPDSHEMVVIAQVRVERLDRGGGRRVGQGQGVPGRPAVGRPAEAGSSSGGPPGPVSSWQSRPTVPALLMASAALVASATVSRSAGDQVAPPSVDRADVDTVKSIAPACRSRPGRRSALSPRGSTAMRASRRVVADRSPGYRRGGRDGHAPATSRPARPSLGSTGR